MNSEVVFCGFGRFTCLSCLWMVKTAPRKAFSGGFSTQA
ncbi:hypothetical protein OHAE_970 [Ochrobactrum soli]|uniref:Uncharacterized protein n=1 Tax=Ochrobactrum soli TaxID=2448455 RepID=A0A2P9HM80_9HYPH|nr:hypothetical protein OHAE_970 [[Ochrobactrum] soli]